MLLLAISNKNAERKTDGVSLFFVPRESEGITITPLSKLGMRALSSCTVNLENVFVPDDLLLGEEGNVWKQTTKTLNSERIMMSAMCLGMILSATILFRHKSKALGMFTLALSLLIGMNDAHRSLNISIAQYNYCLAFLFGPLIYLTIQEVAQIQTLQIKS